MSDIDAQYRLLKSFSRVWEIFTFIKNCLTENILVAFKKCLKFQELLGLFLYLIVFLFFPRRFYPVILQMSTACMRKLEETANSSKRIIGKRSLVIKNMKYQLHYAGCWKQNCLGEVCHHYFLYALVSTG